MTLEELQKLKCLNDCHMVTIYPDCKHSKDCSSMDDISKIWYAAQAAQQKVTEEKDETIAELKKQLDKAERIAMRGLKCG